MHWLQELTALQEQISARRLSAFVGTAQRALIETAADGYLEARLPENSVVRVPGDATLVGRRAVVQIDDARSWIMTGQILSVED